MTTLALPAGRAARIGRSVRRADPVLLAAATVCSLLVLLAVLGPLLAPYPPSQTDLLAASQGPSAEHLLGTDSLGRDILSRLMNGARLSFMGPGLIVVLSLTLGTGLGIVAAWRGGIVDSALSKVFNVVFALPGILVAIVAGAVFGGGFWAPVLALSLVYTPYVARVVRSAAVTERRMAYVEACELADMPAWRICTHHILRNLLPIVLAQATISFGSALMDFGAASFLGVGIQPPQAEWGLMVSEGQADLLDGAMAQTLSAGLMILISVVAFNTLGERLGSRAGGRR
ncbi:ABC transporter permease [Streptomyces graminilatus]|uniref:ABC transporter permease n=1 Tax=Streptomyces graminilatus TaxID=1464070 RepID=UPI000A4007DA|nr:ABC transporter permease [Streptomyces graminilatus]